MEYQINLTYFKPSGKYYTCGDYYSQKLQHFQVIEEIKVMQKKGRLPGLYPNCGKDLFIHVNCAHRFSVSHLITPIEEK